jgi:hypothetical protein
MIEHYTARMSCWRVAAKLRLGRNVLDMIAQLVITCKRSRPLWQGDLIVQFSDLADQARKRMSYDIT